MLTTSQVDHFRTFGFIVLRGYLADRISALRAETDAAIRDAYAATYDERVIDGISGHYLPMASRLTPVSTSLVCDDPRLIDAAEQLLGGPVIPECPEGVLYFSEAGWHTDDGIGVRGVKFAVYVDQLTGDTGALRLVPGSHHPEQNARLAAYSRRGPDRSEAEAAACQASFPGFIADTAPGDGIAFDLHTWHASFGGRDRLAWTAVYQRCPQTGPECDRTLRSVHDSLEQAFRGFDRTRYPVWRDWLAGAAAHPRRAGVIERMRQAGVLDLPGARDGW
ncbi:MAG TPA: phytanoyl-CoA dioxygenase family protein [Streptosporangiaceae bacterium]|nr:phytanoyl-CoA dioxygenase family protein [Streptosporangiaceae bacterium]